MENKTPPPNQNNNNGEYVILLHGILDNAFKMKWAEHQIKKAGYDVLNISYPSTRHTFEELADFIRDQLAAVPELKQAKKIHFVTHSMGGLVTRYYIHKHRPPNLGRVVMMGTPNTGSEFADFFSEQPALRGLFDKVCGPAGNQLRTVHVHDEKMKVDYELGIIAGCVSINPLAPFILRSESDGTVPVARTKIDGMKDHIVLRSTHVFMVYSPHALAQVIHFLKHGNFNHPPAPEKRPPDDRPNFDI